MKVASYLYRRKSALLKGLVLGCTVWLTVTVLLFMEDRRIAPASGGGGGGGGSYQVEAQAQRLSAAYDDRLLDDEFPLEGGVEQQQQPAAVVQTAARTSSKRSQAAAAAAAIAPQSGQGVLPQPNGDGGGGIDGGVGVGAGIDGGGERRALYGEMGKPVVLPANLTAGVQKLVDDGWKNNAFNQYVSDLVSVHRTLPDPRDEW